MSIDDAWQQIEGYIKIYNEARLNNAIGFLTPKEVFERKMNQRLAKWHKKLDQAMEIRRDLSFFESISNSIPVWTKTDGSYIEVDISDKNQSIFTFWDSFYPDLIKRIL